MTNREKYKEELIDLAIKRNIFAEKLYEYEELEEQGKLLKLPCDIGDKLYYVDENNSDKNDL